MAWTRFEQPSDLFLGQRVHLPLARTRDGHRLGRIAEHETPQHRLAECAVQDGVGLLHAAS